MTEDTTTKMLFQTKWLINRDISHQIKDGKLLDDSEMNQRDNEHEEKHDNGPQKNRTTIKTYKNNTQIGIIQPQTP